MDRPTFLLSLATTALAQGGAIPMRPEPEATPFLADERRAGVRLGVYAIDLRNDKTVVHRPAQRFPMASTFKLPLVMAVLSRVDDNIEQLGRKIAFTSSDIVPFSPVVARQPRGGSLTVAQLCGAAIEESDNTAANLLLAAVAGPPGVTAYLRRIGDPTTRLDRNEPALNRSAPNDPRDTTTPYAMASVLARAVREPILSPGAKTHLFGWMKNAKTGLHRIRAGAPAGWSAGDKTGTTDTGASDVAVLWPPSGAPIVMAVYADGVRVSDAARDALFAGIARRVVRRLRG
jgi:beta-lactamase class A